MPGLTVVRVGEDPAQAAFVRSKGHQCREAGMASFEHMRAAETPQHELIAFIAGLNAHAQVHGILVHLPLLREYWKDR